MVELNVEMHKEDRWRRWRTIFRWLNVASASWLNDRISLP